MIFKLFIEKVLYFDSLLFTGICLYFINGYLLFIVPFTSLCLSFTHGVFLWVFFLIDREINTFYNVLLFRHKATHIPLSGVILSPFSDLSGHS